MINSKGGRWGQGVSNALILGRKVLAITEKLYAHSPYSKVLVIAARVATDRTYFVRSQQVIIHA